MVWTKLPDPNATLKERVQNLETHLVRLRGILAALGSKALVEQKKDKWDAQDTDTESEIETLRVAILGASDDLETARAALGSLGPDTFSLSGDTTSATHSRGFKPLVKVLNSSGEDVTLSGITITHTDNNTVEVSGAGGAFSGTLLVL